MALTRPTWNRLALLTAMASALLPSLAWAPTATAAPAWSLEVMTDSHATPGGTMLYRVRATNVGTTAAGQNAAPSCASNPAQAKCYPVAVAMPPGIVATAASGTSWSCSGAPALSAAMTVTCVRGTGNNNVVNVGASTPFINITASVDGGAALGGAELSTEIHGGDPANCAAPPTATPPCPSATKMSSFTITDAPDYGVEAFDGQVTGDALGNPFTQAGGHPYAISTQIDFNTIFDPLYFDHWPIEPPRDIVVDLPPGLVGDPTGIAACTTEQLAPTDAENPLCPPESQVGVATITANRGSLTVPPVVLSGLPVYNLVAPPDVPARFGLNAFNTIVTLDAELRSGTDYGLTINVGNVSEGIALVGTALTFWGVPADPAHDAQRFCPGIITPGCASSAALKPFLRNPTACTPDGVGLVTVLRTDSWVDPGDFKVASFESHLPPGYPLPPDEWGEPIGPTGCGLVPFDASLSAEPKAAPPEAPGKAGVPSGFEFDLSIPQEDVGGIAPSDLKKAVVTLPVGVRVSPSAAHGLKGCSSAEIALDSAADPTCPDASKVGSLTIDTPLLDEQLSGSVYLATPFDNPSDSLLAIYLVAKGPGLIVKLPGKVDADPLTGQLTTTFDDNPQLPFSNLHLEFNGGPTAQLVNPPDCGTYTTHAEFTSWSGKTVVSESSFEISRDGKGAPCPPRPFTPEFEAGVENPVAGASSPFLMSLSRDDEDQEIGSLSIDMPKGLLARVADVALCSATQAKAGTCGSNSLIGSVITGAGPGPHPFYITNGRVYLTEGYRGAPFGLSIVVPAVAGPFDLGLVVVRAALHIDRETAELTVVSDPVPQALQGIRLQVRDIRVAVDRDGFMLNPTNCSPKRVNGTIESTQGTKARVGSRFQVGNCSDLRFRPRMGLRVGGKGKTQKGRSTPLVATLRQGKGQAAMRSVGVTLPTSINALLTVINDACTRAQFDAGDCEDARAGRAVAVTPLLAKPLRGSAYFVKNGNPLPDLIVALKGQVDFDLVGRISIPGSKRLRTVFGAVPDVPVSRFTLRLQGGREGILGVARNLCSKQAKRQRARAVFRGQNGRVIRTSQRLKVAGCKKAARKRR